MDTRHRVALVTGANRGLGLEASRQLLAKGLTVVMAGRDEAALGRAAIIRMDVTDARSIAEAHRVGRERVGPQGADTIVWLATLPDEGPTGGFFHDRRAIQW